MWFFVINIECIFIRIFSTFKQSNIPLNFYVSIDIYKQLFNILFKFASFYIKFTQYHFLYKSIICLNRLSKYNCVIIDFITKKALQSFLKNVCRVLLKLLFITYLKRFFMVSFLISSFSFIFINFT